MIHVAVNNTRTKFPLHQKSSSYSSECVKSVQQCNELCPICVSCPLQEVVRNSVSGGLPAAVQPRRLLPLPSLHRRVLRGGEVCFCQLRSGEAKRLSEHHGEPLRSPPETDTRLLRVL